MDKEHWSVFCQTGDPVSYLLCRAGEEKKKQEKKTAEKPKEPPAGGLSVQDNSPIKGALQLPCAGLGLSRD